MKNFILLLLSLVSLTVNAQNVNIPDPEFLKDLIKKGIDKNKDGKIQLTEAEGAETLSVAFNKIASIEGLGAFTNLKKLYLSSPSIKSIDISKNIKLETLNCSKIQIDSLDISKNIGLKMLEIYDTPISKLDVSKNINLEYLDCKYNQLTSIDVTNNLALTYLFCNGNKISSLDVSKNVNLIKLWCGQNKLALLDISNNLALEYFYCGENLLASLDVSKNIALKELICQDNQLKVLDISNNALLLSLTCSFNFLKTLDVSKNSKLYSFSCHNNPALFIICVNKDQLNQTLDFNPDHFWHKDNHASWAVDCGMVSIPKIQKSETEPTLLNIYNLIGQEVSTEQAKGGVFIYRYSDGSVRRIWNNGSN